MDFQAMHIANGIVNAPVSAVFAVIAVAALAICVLRGRADLDDRLAPMAGLVAAFIFAVQMLNFQVLPGVSGHLLGGTLAAMLVGPWVGALCVSTVLIVQCLLFADGGLTALGLNITNMALLGTAAGYLLIAGLLRVLPKTAVRRRDHRVRRLGGQRRGRLAGLRPGVRLGGTTAAVRWRRRRHDGRRAHPDRHRRGPDRRDHRRHGGQGPARPGVRAAPVPRPRPAASRPGRAEVPHDASGSAGSSPAACWSPLLLAGVVSNFASSQPGRPRRDRPARAARSTPTATSPAAPAWPSRSRTTRLKDSPLADYGIRGIDNEYLSTGLSGVLGVLVTFAHRRRRLLAGPPPRHPAATTRPGSDER